MKILNIRSKLTLAFVAIFGATLIVFSLILYGVFANQTRNDLDKILTVLASSVSETIKRTGVKQSLLNEIQEMNIPFTYASNEYVEVFDISGKIMLKSDQLENDSFPISKDVIDDVLKGKNTFKTSLEASKDNLWDEKGIRLVYYPAVHKNQKYVVAVAASLSNLENQLGNLRLIFYISIPLTLLFSTAIGWLFSKRAYTPVKQLITTAESITAQNLSSRLPENKSGDEIAQLAATLNNMIERLENSFNIQKQFTSDASHELKTPLTILRGEIEVALQKERTTEEYRMIVKNGLEEVIRLQNIVEGLLLLSKLETDKLQPLKDRINLNETVTDAVSKVNILANKKNIKVILKLDENGDNGFNGIYVKGDQKKLTNVFLNLLDNALKYSNENSEIFCTVKRIPGDSKVNITISDRGIGIPESELNRIFERFYRVDTSRTRDDSFSLGLGLSIARAVIESHGGNIKVQSKVGQGSSFRINLPLAP